jgi:hypothetical protein
MTWVLLVIVLVALVTAACRSFRDRGISLESATIPSFTPTAENDKVILVKGWNESEVRKIIHGFIELYKDAGYPAHKIESNKNSANLYRLTFPQDIHPELFTFLINYLAYPFELDLTDRSIIVVGRSTLSSSFEGIDSSLIGEKAILYIPENDEEHTIVYMQTASGVNLANSFTNVKWRRVNDARLTNEVKNLIGDS